MRYRSKREYGWSDTIAYSVGLMASDGCLQSDGRHLDLTSVDTDQLMNFQKAINRDLTITIKRNASEQPAYRIQFSDVAYYDFLQSVGLTPAKSKTIAALNIPDEYYASFLRGLFDGDGTCYEYFDRRWPNSYMYYVGFTSASRAFLEYISAKNQALFGVKGTSIRQSHRALTLVYAKRDSYKLYLAMYRDAGDLSLIRKRNKLEGFINSEGNAIIAKSCASGEMVNTLP